MGVDTRLVASYAGYSIPIKVDYRCRQRESPKTRYCGSGFQCASVIRCSSTQVTAAGVIAPAFHSSIELVVLARAIIGATRDSNGLSRWRLVPTGNELSPPAYDATRSQSCPIVGTSGAEAPAPRTKQVSSCASAVRSEPIERVRVDPRLNRAPPQSATADRESG